MVEVFHSFIRGLDREPKVLLLIILLLTQGLIHNPQKCIDVYSCISVGGYWVSALLWGLHGLQTFGRLHRNIL